MVDSLLITELNAGSRKAFSSLYDKYAGMVYGFACSVLKNETLAEDITQLCFMQLWEHKESISAGKNLPAWLYVSARNAIYKELRRQVTATKYIDFAALHSENSQRASEGDADFNLIHNEMNRVIDSLPETRRKVFIMKTFQEMSVKEIAEALGISPKTVETHLRRAYTALREDIAKIILSAVLGVFLF